MSGRADRRAPGIGPPVCWTTGVFRGRRREGAMSQHDDKEPLVTVFETADPALMPLAVAELEQAGIAYGYRPAEGQFPVVFGHPAAFIDTDGAVEIVVREADASRARDLLADLERTDSAPALGAPEMVP